MKNQWLKEKILRDSKVVSGKMTMSTYDLLTKAMWWSEDEAVIVLQKMKKNALLDKESRVV